MSAFGGLVLTTKGLALQAKIQTGTALVFNRIGIGAGSLGSLPITAMNALISEKMSLPISKLQVQQGGKAIVGGVLSNQDVTAGFFFREIGIFAQDPDNGEILYCYANSGTGAEYISAAGGTDLIEKSIDIITLTANASSISANISSGIYASTDDLNLAVSNSIKLILSPTAPVNPAANTWWYQDMGDSYDIGDGLIIANASLDNTTMVFFEEI
ncbi:phage tail protein [Paenibacillus sp. NPDC058367]|uniref:phage tail-collar fiber domain-containing protein n=1 Tax=Paenibacillus sp. NPDC058367 TaxID=3346460 RepID=UPI00364624E4